MKQNYIALVCLTVYVLTGCQEKQNDTKPTETKTTGYSTIEGNWETVSFEVNGKQTKPKRFPQQFKMFHEGFFSLVMYGADGNFSFACAGTYKINGGKYEETCTYHSDTTYIGFKDSQKWEMRGDTLVFYGFEKAEMADGKDVTQKFNENGTFIEKRVSAKR